MKNSSCERPPLWLFVSTKTILALKFTTAMMLGICLQVSARSYGQKININFTNAPIEKVFREIEKQSGFAFVYSNSDIDKAAPISVHVSEGSIDEVLKACLKDAPLTYEISERTIIIREKLAALHNLITIAGVVLSEADEPIEGVTVRVRNSGRGTITNAKGEFMLKDIAEESQLVISSVGFKEEQVLFQGKTNIIIHLKMVVKGLDETVVKGYYTTSKRFNTGSVSKVNAEEIASQPVGNILNALSGRVTGLYVQQGSGLPGSAVYLKLRGQNSIAAGNSPLIVMDGVPITSTSLTSYFSGPTGLDMSTLSNLSPQDIETVEVLKDADATAIYGSRGANGVILITTRKGKAGKSGLDFNFYTGFGRVTKMPHLLDSKQFLAMRHEAFANDQATPGPFDFDLNGTWDTTRYTNWPKELMGNAASITDAQMSYSAGNANTQILLGGGYHREGTIMPGNFYDEKSSFHLRVNSTSSNKRFRVGFSGSYIHDHNELPQDNPLLSIALAPVSPQVYNNDGTLNWANSTWTNPLAFLYRQHRSASDNLISSIDISYEITKGFYFKTTAGFTQTNFNEVIKTPKRYYDPQFADYVQNEANFATNSIRSWIAEPQLNFSKALGKGQLEVLAGLTFQENQQHVLAQTGSGYLTESLMDNLKGASFVQINGADDIDYKYNAVFGRIGYRLLEKWLFNFTGRRDGSSRFGPGRQFANFGAAGIGWIFSKEKFIEKALPALTYGKIRVSYGITGNDQIGDYNYFDSYAPISNLYLGVNPLNPQRINNPNYSWEVNKKFEAGIELGFWNNRVYASFDYFRNRSSNQLVGYPLPATTGFGSLQYNLPAIVQNTGIEVELSAMVISHDRFKWTVDFNLTVPRNKLVAYPLLSSSAYANRYEVGRSLFIDKRLHYTGIDRQSGLYTVEDVNKDGNVSFPEDIVAGPGKEQQYFGGFGNSISYKQFDLTIFFQFVRQTGINYTGYGLFSLPGVAFNVPIEVLNRWTPQTPNAEVQRFTAAHSSDAITSFLNFYNSDGAYSDASFIRLKNLSLSYNLPDGWLRKMHTQHAKIFVQAQNLLTITHYKVLDPESQRELPPLRVITAGIHLTF